MSSPSLRRPYLDTRVLVDAARVLSPSCAALSVALDPAHVEILRNIVEYARRRETYVSEYNVGWYEMPDDSDWDDIDAIVAELEYRLMPSDNIPFGVNESWEIATSVFATSSGYWSLDFPALASGYVYVLQSAALANFNRDSGTGTIQIIRGSQPMYLAIANPALVFVGVRHVGDLVLWPGDIIRFTLSSVVAADSLRAHVAGYKMVSS